ncbi:LysR family transcriptional regulator [Erwinia sorbitola]|uniref:LysR family transcriptional regulator n=1 Tax=Erwinia sorbitola TaxID=2681984 RepID=A0A6I6EQS8_9GAMM|nr:LysR family transcriptional regulator [Erwinia sorbitola]MTD28408.1 LysR family transcriptional regulator [Erwinia sorbitola]QGU86523.1 LysR family transcriptional regulator [Erwinia sorbitola]
MNLQHLKPFIVLTEELNFHKAAKRLNITQPPLSRAIMQLEESLGVSLFLRLPKGIELTAAGRAFRDYALTILELADIASEQTVQTAEGYSGRLDVGLFNFGGLQSVPHILAHYHRARPDVKICIHNLSKAEQITALHKRQLSIGFCRFPSADPDISIDRASREAVYVALHVSHPLCQLSEISLEDLEGEPLILYPNDAPYGLRHEVCSAFRSQGMYPTIEHEVDDVMSCITLVASEFGVGITTHSGTYLKLPGVEYRRLKNNMLNSIDLNCIYRSDDTSPLLASFLEVIRELRDI